MLDHPGRAIWALEAMPAMAAEGEGGIAAAVEKEQGLLAARQIGLDLADQGRRQPPAARRRVGEEVDGGAVGHLRYPIADRKSSRLNSSPQCAPRLPHPAC